MSRIIIGLALLACGSVSSSGQDASYQSLLSDENICYSSKPSVPVVEEEVCASVWERLHGFLFRRYAGSVEMESKTPYPKSYHGRYTYLPWKPDWVRTPANQVRESRYRHHFRLGEFDEIEQHPYTLIPADESVAPGPLPETMRPSPEDRGGIRNLEEVEVQPPR